jgi:hypothetical protein
VGGWGFRRGGELLRLLLLVLAAVCAQQLLLVDRVVRFKHI